MKIEGTDSESSNGMMEESMKVNGKMESSMGLESTEMPKVKNKEENGTKGKESNGLKNNDSSIYIF